MESSRCIYICWNSLQSGTLGEPDAGFRFTPAALCHSSLSKVIPADVNTNTHYFGSPMYHSTNDRGLEYIVGHW